MERIRIYALKCNKTGDIRYIGYTKKSLHERLLGHLANVREAFDYKRRKINKRLSWLKSINCNVSIIEIDEGYLEDVEWLESMYISLFKTWGYKLTNMTTGGDGGNTWNKLTDEQKKIAGAKISKAVKGKKKPPRTEEHRRKLRENHALANGRVIPWNKGLKTKRLAKERREKASRCHMNVRKSKYGPIKGTKLVLGTPQTVTFKVPGVAVIYLGIKDAGNIIAACKGRIPTAYGYKWEFVN